MPPKSRPNLVGFSKSRDAKMNLLAADIKYIMAVGSARSEPGGLLIAK